MEVLTKFLHILADKRKNVAGGEVSAEKVEPTTKMLRALTQLTKPDTKKSNWGSKKATKATEGIAKAPKNTKSLDSIRDKNY